MTQRNYTSEELRNLFGFKSEKNFQNFLNYSRYQPAIETLNDFCLRVNHRTLDEQFNHRRKLRKKLNKKSKEYKVYIRKINPVNPMIKKIILKKIENKEIIILNVYFYNIVRDTIMTDPSTIIKLKENRNIEIEYNYENITSIEIQYLLVEEDYKILDPSNIILETNSVEK